MRLQNDYRGSDHLWARLLLTNGPNQGGWAKYWEYSVLPARADFAAAQGTCTLLAAPVACRFGHGSQYLEPRRTLAQDSVSSTLRLASSVCRANPPLDGQTAHSADRTVVLAERPRVLRDEWPGDTHRIESPLSEIAVGRGEMGKVR